MPGPRQLAAAAAAAAAAASAGFQVCERSRRLGFTGRWHTQAMPGKLSHVTSQGKLVGIICRRPHPRVRPRRHAAQRARADMLSCHWHWHSSLMMLASS